MQQTPDDDELEGLEEFDEHQLDEFEELNASTASATFLSSSGGGWARGWTTASRKLMESPLLLKNLGPHRTRSGYARPIVIKTAPETMAAAETTSRRLTRSCSWISNRERMMAKNGAN